MNLNNIPFIAIVGGFFELTELKPNKFEEAKSIAKEIGGALAKAGMGLVVYYSNELSLEPHVVSGYVAALPKGEGKGSIKVRFAQSQKGEVKFVEQDKHNELFDLQLFAGKEWEAPFYRSLVEEDGGVDGVLLMAGARSTLIAGQITVARSLPVLAIEQFDGAAGIIWTELATRTANYPSLRTKNPDQLVKWFNDKILAWKEQRERVRKSDSNYLKIVSQRRKSIWVGLAFMALLITVFFGMAKVPNPNYYTFLTFIGLITAGATGATIRSVISKTEENAPMTSLILGSVAGFIVGLAYLIPQWVGAPGVLEASSTIDEIQIVDATDKIQFVSAILVAISAGIGFDTIFRRLKKQADNQPISPPGQN
jgi:hypothetical protein